VTVLDWPLTSGVAPPLLLTTGGLALLFLITRRHDRRWWYILGTVAAAATVLVGLLMVTTVLLAPFPDPLPGVVWWAIGVAAATAGVAITLLRGRRRPLSGIGVALSAVLVVAAAGNQVNVQFGQFPTPRSLLGLPASNQVDMGRLSPAAAVTVSRPNGRALDATWRAPAGMPPSGAVSEVSIPGTVSGFAARPAWLYLPPAYLASPRAQLPVLVLLAGQPGSPRDWLDGGGLAATMDRFAAAHHGLAPVVVVPDNLGSVIANPLCLDSRLGRVQTYLTLDVPAWVQTHMQIDGTPGSWAVGGSSAGGTCALQLALNAPALYPTFLDVSGQTGPTLGDRARTVAAAFGGNTSAFAAVEPLDQLARHRYAVTSGCFVVGSADTLYRPQAQQVTAAARHAGMNVRYQEVPGGHDWRVGAQALDAALPWLATRMHITTR
jgi:S-formylglutathione hydrolase FrmB